MTVSRAADRDLIDIWLYTAREWSVEQADDYEREIRDAMQFAADHSYLGSPFAFGSKPYRKRLVGPHKLIYRATAKTVVIVRIIHGARDEAGRNR